ncbi:MAG: hypothetical protein LBB94_07100 [Clostridiales bacterium]|nr:hypothetical protein [Clostridiales bacterium]
MRLFRLNLNAPNDWRGDFGICVKAIKRAAVFCAAVGLITLAFILVYRLTADDAKPYDVYSAKDWEVAVNDPFVDTVILHKNIRLTAPKKRITIIRDYTDLSSQQAEVSSYRVFQYKQ